MTDHQSALKAICETAFMPMTASRATRFETIIADQMLKARRKVF